MRRKFFGWQSMLVGVWLLSPNAQAIDLRVLTPEELQCRIWEVKRLQEKAPDDGAAHATWLIDAKTMAILFESGPSAKDMAHMQGSPLYMAWMKREIPVTGSDSNKYRFLASCRVSGVESSLPADQINNYLRTQLSSAIHEAAKLQMLEFLNELKAANTQIQQEMIRTALENLKNDKDLIKGLKTEIMRDTAPAKSPLARKVKAGPVPPTATN